MEILVPTVALLVLLGLGVPIAFCLALSGALGILMITGNFSIVEQYLGHAVVASASDITLGTIPTFILMAFLAANSGLASDAYSAAAKWFGGTRGGLGGATTVASGVFGAMSGASTASAAVMSRVAYPSMKLFRYSDALSTGTIAVGSTLSVLIPPSVGMVVYSITTETSLRDLLNAGVVPGLVMLILIILSVVVWAVLKPDSAPRLASATLREKFLSLKPVWLTLVVIGALMLLLYSGVATPTEIGASGAVIIGLVGLLRRKLSPGLMLDALLQTLKISAMLFLIISGAHIFGYFMTLSRAPYELSAWVSEVGFSRWIVLAFVCIIFFVFSMFMDENPLLLIMLPITFPLIMAQGFDPVWFGIVMMLLVAMGLTFPPVGVVSFIVAGTTGVSVSRVFHGASVLIVPILITLVLILVFPQIALWLPELVRQ